MPLVALLCASAAAAQSRPVVDSARGLADSGLPREAPLGRGLGLSDLYPPQVRTETAPIDALRLLAEDAASSDSGPLRMGVVRDFPAVDTDTGGTWTPLFGGEEGWLWTASFRAPEARGVRLRFSDWDPLPGVELRLANAARPDEVFGPLTCEHGERSGVLWTPAIYHQEVEVELFLPAPYSPADLSGRVGLDALLHQYRLPGAPTGGGFDGALLPCHLDLACYPTWGGTGDGIGILSYVSAPSGFFCSGAMLNRVAGDFTPILATARHCGVTNATADSLLVTWLYEASSCGGLPPSPGSLPQSFGHTVLVQDPDTDFTLVGLDFHLPPVEFIGWDSGPWVAGSFAAGIHHPEGSWKRITFGSKIADLTSSCVGGNAFHLINWPDGNGEIQPGSSGSPILDSAQRMRGVASCSSWGCGVADSTSYGKFDAAWPELSPYLASVDPIYVDDSASGPETGTSADPFDEMIEAAYAVNAGSTVNIANGTYDLEFTVSKAMTLNASSGTVVIR